LTDIYWDSNQGFFFLHGPESPNIIASGFLEHVLLEVPEHGFEELSKTAAELQITACVKVDGVCTD
jgi:hypothetical protein